MHSVLIVDDDPCVRYTVSTVLELEGIAVRTVESGAQCLAELANGFRGLILLDVMMPGMDGWQTIQAIRDAGHTTGNLIYLLTACHDPSPRLEHLKESVVDYLRKPFVSSELLGAVRDALEYLQQEKATDAPRTLAA